MRAVLEGNCINILEGVEDSGCAETGPEVVGTSKNDNPVEGGRLIAGFCA